MTTLAYVTDPLVQTWETGDLVCYDISTGKGVSYDPNLPVVGAALVPPAGYGPNGRQWYAINGSPYYDNDEFVWNEDLTCDFSTTNPSYSPFNPFDPNYVVVITNGVGVVKNTAVGIPASWVKLKTGVMLDRYLIK